MLFHQANTPTIDAPCVRNCCLDEQDICMGCGRHLSEIQQWHSLSAEQRSELLAVATKRRKSRLRSI